MNTSSLPINRRVAPLFLVLFLLAGVTRASEPFLVADIDTTGTGSFPGSFVELGGLVYFIADDSVHGRELWVSDNSFAGTHRVTDLAPGAGNSLSFELVVFDDRLFFPATAGGPYAELWTSDGTEEGTASFGDSAVIGTGVRTLTRAGDRLFYVATLDGTQQLFVSDGSLAGTLALSLPIIPFVPPDEVPPLFVDPRNLTPTDAPGAGAGPILFFTARQDSFPTLWVTDGTPGGTAALPQVVEPMELAALQGGRVVAAVETRPNAETWELWVSDGTEGGTEVLLELTSSGGPFIDLLTVAGGRLFFTVSDGYGSFDLWLTDGTASGTVQVAPLLTEQPEEVPRLASYAPLDERLVFQGFAPATGYELWISDGTPAGTEIFNDIVPGPGSSEPRGLVSAPNQVFFSASTPEHGRELWATGIPFDDLTFATYRVTDANPGPGDSTPGALRLLGDRLWLSLSDGMTGPEPWISDGSPNGTRSVAILNTMSTSSSRPFPVAKLGSLLFFTLTADPEHLLWRSDGSASGTFSPNGAGGGARLSDPFEPALAHGDFLYFEGFAPASSAGGLEPEHELWRSDGENAEPVTALGAGDIGPPAGLDGRVLFAASVEGELGLYGAGDGPVVQLADLGPSSVAATTRVYSGSRHAFVLAEVGAMESSLWISDGTPPGTRRVTTLSREAPFHPAYVFGDRLFFVDTTPETGLELWTSDGTAAGTRLAVDLFPGDLPGNPRDFAALDGWLYFVANTAGGELDDIGNVWRIDPTGTVFERVHDRCVQRLVPVSWSLLFTPCSRRNALWILEGEPPAAQQVTIVEPDFASSFPLPIIDVMVPGSGVAYFDVKDVESSQTLAQIWATDGTLEGTRVFTDLTIDAPSAGPPQWFEQAGGLVFFDADDGIHGRELWAAPLECFATSRTLCLGDDRFQARARWRDFVGKAGAAPTVPVSNESGGFWFFDEANPELFLKTLDGRSINDRYWVFFGSLSNVPFDVEVLDTSTGAERLYRNPSGRFASFGDTDAFDGETGGTTTIVPPSARPPMIGTDSVGAAPCVAGPLTQCQLGRFRVEVQWHDFAGQSGPGKVRGLSGDLDGFWFFDRDNVELVVKVLDGRPINGRYWVFFGSLTNVAFDLIVTDTSNGDRRIYRNPLSNFASFGDTDAFVP